MTFRRAVESAHGLERAHRKGLQALRRDDRARIQCSQPRRLRGSVDLDEALRRALPNEPRWDYAVGWSAGGSEQAIWVEVHPATSQHVSEVLEKLRWLRNWLSTDARELLRMTRGAEGFVWLATDGVCLQRTSPQARQLAAAGISFPRRRLHLG